VLYTIELVRSTMTAELDESDDLRMVLTNLSTGARDSLRFAIVSKTVEKNSECPIAKQSHPCGMRRHKRPKEPRTKILYRYRTHQINTSLPQSFGLASCWSLDVVEL
jgi:hypothetical protein